MRNYLLNIHFFSTCVCVLCDDVVGERARMNEWYVAIYILFHYMIQLHVLVVYLIKFKKRKKEFLLFYLLKTSLNKPILRQKTWC
jgi:hypothetical protein